MGTHTTWRTRIAIGITLTLAAAVQLVPFYLALTTSLKPKADTSSLWTLPTSLFLGNFETAIVEGGILQSIASSALVTVITTVAVCLLGAITAYPLARRVTTGNKIVLLGIVAMMMIPPLSVLVPLYTFVSSIHGINTYWAIVLILGTGALPMSVFLYASFMRGLPVSVEEAATMDGAGTWTMLFRVVFPMLKPVTATVAILTSVAIWNEYALSNFFLRDPSVRTIAPTIATYFGSQNSNLGAAVAGALISVVPVLVAYLVLQRYFIRGMVAGAEK
jgi:raffinose/stachyose/melibiose transport system permease protein